MIRLRTTAALLLGFPLLAACSSMARTPDRTVPTPASLAGEPAIPPAAAPAPVPPRAELTPEVLYYSMLGEIAAQRGQFEVAVESLSRAARATRDPRLAERATSVALYAKMPAAAQVTGRLWVELEPTNAEAREALAGALLQSGRLDEARAQLAKIIELTKPDTIGNAYLRVAGALGKQQDRAAGVSIMQGLAALHPRLPEAQFAVAHLAVRAGDLDSANTAIDQALKLRPDWEDAAIFKARILVSNKEEQKALAWQESFLSSYPKARSFRLNYARYLVEIKQYDRARAQFKRVAEMSPPDAEALYAVALLAMQANVDDEAETYFRRTLDLQPENDQARLYLGELSTQQKRYDQAIRWYREVAEGPYYFEAQARIGITLARAGRLAEARAHLEALRPESEPQMVQKALSQEQVLREARQYKEALKVLSAAIAELPDNADLLYARALIAERLDMLDMVEQDLRRVLRQDPKNVQALNALGYTLADRTTRYKEALGLLEQALALKPEDAFIMDSMGWVQYRLGNHNEALKYLRGALQKRSDAEIAAHLGEVMWVTGDRAGAESVWSRALKDTPDNEALLGVIKKFKR